MKKSRQGWTCFHYTLLDPTPALGNQLKSVKTKGIRGAQRQEMLCLLLAHLAVMTKLDTERSPMLLLVQDLHTNLYFHHMPWSPKLIIKAQQELQGSKFTSSMACCSWICSGLVWLGSAAPTLCQPLPHAFLCSAFLSLGSLVSHMARWPIPCPFLLLLLLSCCSSFSCLVHCSSCLCFW
jgi:hypothetical protein